MSIATDRYAVFGSPIKHSKSPRIHQLFAQQTSQQLSYTAEQVLPEDFTSAVGKFFGLGGKGLNCTVPLKELAWKLAENRTQRAELSKAVNTLAIQPDGVIAGDNTDGVGLINDLLNNHAIQLKDIDILILGAGGASRGIIAPILEQSPAKLVVANRTVAKAIQLASEFTVIAPVSGCGFNDLEGSKFDLIVNATSASLSDQLPPLPDSLLAANGNCYDLAYANQATAFVRWGVEHDAEKSLDGLGMLVEQAAEAFYLWRKVRPQTEPVIRLLESERQD